MNTLIKTKNILNKYELKANKRFGQNFLIDDSILKNIVDISEICEDDLIIEIGPGLGNLTEYILNRCAHCLLVEIDKNMLEILKNRLSNFTNYTLLNEDFLNINLDKKIEELEKLNGCSYKRVKVVANLPYYITTPIIFKLLQESIRISTITVMVQKEVAQRMVANIKTKDYGILTLMIKFLSIPKIEYIVPREAFIPSPNVTSAIVTLKKEKRYYVKDEKLFFKIIHASFAQRRKKMINSLISSKVLDLSKEELSNALKVVGIDELKRAEEIELQDYIKLADYISNN